MTVQSAIEIESIESNPFSDCSISASYSLLSLTRAVSVQSVIEIESIESNPFNDCSISDRDRVY